MINTKKGFGGGLMALASTGIALVVLIFVLTIGSNLTQTIRDQYSYNSTTGDVLAMNISQSGLESFDLFANWFDIIILIIIAVLVIGMLMLLKFRG